MSEYDGLIAQIRRGGLMTISACERAADTFARLAAEQGAAKIATDQRDAAERARNRAQAEMVKAEDALLATLGLLEVVQAERDALRAEVTAAQSAGRCACGWGAAGLASPCIGHALAIRKAVADAVAKEREACALVANKCEPAGWLIPQSIIIAAAIRARGETQT